MNWGNISAQKLERERSESFAVSISLKRKTIRSYFRVHGTKISPKFREIEPKLVKITMRVRRTQLIFHSSSEVGLYFGLEAGNFTFKKFGCFNFTAKQGHLDLV